MSIAATPTSDQPPVLSDRLVVSDAELEPFRNLRRLDGRYAPKLFVVTGDTHAYVHLLHRRRLDPRRCFLYDELAEALVDAGQCQGRGVAARVLVLEGGS